MARITVEDCQQQVNNRFLLVQMAIKRVKQYREGYDSLVESRNKEVVTSLREIAKSKVLIGRKTEKDLEIPADGLASKPDTQRHFPGDTP